MKKISAVAVAAALGFSGSNAANAALASNAVLSIDAGSFFGMEVSPGFVLPTSITGYEGIKLGVAQPASGSHSGAPDGSESPSIDNPWLFFNNTGMHFTNAPITILSDDGAGNVTLDFSGWRVTWNGVPEINMGQGAPATMTCATDCSVGDTYTLDYAAVVPNDGTTNFGGVNYSLHLEGTVVPVPAAVWLFGSGLVGLVGVARRKKAA